MNFGKNTDNIEAPRIPEGISIIRLAEYINVTAAAQQLNAIDLDIRTFSSSIAAPSAAGKNNFITVRTFL